MKKTTSAAKPKFKFGLTSDQYAAIIKAMSTIDKRKNRTGMILKIKGEGAQIITFDDICIQVVKVFMIETSDEEFNHEIWIPKVSPQSVMVEVFDDRIEYTFHDAAQMVSAPLGKEITIDFNRIIGLEEDERVFTLDGKKLSKICYGFDSVDFYRLKNSKTIVMKCVKKNSEMKTSYLAPIINHDERHKKLDEDD